MSVRERILAIRIAEAISKHPEIAEELGISAELVECRAVLKEPPMKEKRWAIIRIGTLKHCNLSTIPKRTCKSERPPKQAN